MLVTTCFGNFFVSHLLSENSKIKLYRNIMFTVICTGVKLGLSHRMKNVGWRVFENRVLRKIFGHEGGSEKTSKKIT